MSTNLTMTTEFTPFAAFFGGTLIGLAAVLLMLAFGRIFGATGIFTGVLLPETLKDFSWRFAVLLGIIASPIAYYVLTGEAPEIQSHGSLGLLIIGGLIVGIGVRFGNGCTSGHGVCGLARLSVRSLVATLVFMATAAMTVYSLRHLLGLY